MKVPPAPTSQTSCQLHSGPMAATTSRRSGGVLATTRWTAQAPKSQPSSTANIVSMKQRMPNQSSIMVPLVDGRLAVARAGVVARARTVRHLESDEIQVQDAEHEVEAGEPDDREE